MKRFKCDRCGQAVYFENVRCVKCEEQLGYSALTKEMLSLELTEQEGHLCSVSGAEFRYCANARLGACNWLIPGDAPAEQALCAACGLNRTIPDVTIPENLVRWQRLEVAKRRLVYSLQRLRLPLESGHDRTGGLLFDFMTNGAEDGSEKPVTTGHADGVITIDALEGDAAIRTDRRQHLGEYFRTLLGHFRHEIGHYYFSELTDSGERTAFRDLFGDERADYGVALDTYYREGPRPDWNARYVTAYASSHAHEDWAETFAHYVHIVDTLDTARAYGMGVRSEVGNDAEVLVDVDSYSETNFERLWELWIPLTVAVNSLNRSMGQDDLYPFVLPPEAIEKLRFVHNCVRESARARDLRSESGHSGPV